MNQNIYKCAAESYMYGVKFLKEYYKDNGYPYFGGFGELRMAIMNLHNAIELLLKAHLATENELLIISDIGNDDVLNIIRFERKDDVKFGLLHYLYHEGNTSKTIEYSEAVRRYAKIFGLEKETQRVLDSLGKYRNMATHLGINKEPVEIFEILAILAKVIELVEDELTYNIDIDDESYSPFEKIEVEAQHMCSVISDESEKLWFEYFREPIMEILYDLSDTLFSNSLKSVFQKNQLEIKYEIDENMEMKDIKISIVNIETQRQLDSIVLAKPLSNTFHIRFYDKEDIAEIIIELGFDGGIPKIHSTSGYIGEDIVTCETYWKDNKLKKELGILSKDYQSELLSNILKNIVLNSKQVRVD